MDKFLSRDAFSVQNSIVRSVCSIIFYNYFDVVNIMREPILFFGRLKPTRQK